MSYDEDFVEEECTNNGVVIRNDSTINQNVISKQFSVNQDVSHYFFSKEL